jgi:hypothetical protein
LNRFAVGVLLLALVLAAVLQKRVGIAAVKGEELSMMKANAMHPAVVESRLPQVFHVDAGSDPILQVFAVPGQSVIGVELESEQMLTATVKGNSVKVDLLAATPGGTRRHFLGVPFSPSEIAYRRGNGLIAYDIQDEKYVGHSPVEIMTESMNYIFPWDLQKRRLLLVNDDPVNCRIMEFPRQPYNDENDRDAELAVRKVIAEIKYSVMHNEGPELVFMRESAFREKLMFFRSDPVETLVALDSEFREVNHPLCELVNTKKVVETPWAFIHPQLPFAFVRGLGEPDSRSSFLARWEHPDQEQQLIPFPVEQLIYGERRDGPFYLWREGFSPDGRWFLFEVDSEDPTPEYLQQRGRFNPTLYVMPVEPDNPMFLGKPIRLGNCLSENAHLQSVAWMNDPVNLVAADEHYLYVWDLGEGGDR